MLLMGIILEERNWREKEAIIFTAFTRNAVCFYYITIHIGLTAIEDHYTEVLKPSGLYILMHKYEYPIKTTPTCTWTALFILYS